MRRRCRRLHPHKGEPAGCGTADYRPCHPGQTDRHLPQTEPIYDRYKTSKDKEKFLRGFESEIILFEAAARDIKKAGLAKLPSTEKRKAKLDSLAARKTALQSELRKIQKEEKKYDILQKNINTLVRKPYEKGKVQGITIIDD